MRLFKKNLTAEQVSQNIDLTGKTVLITGCNSGLGFETARVLALRGVKVLATARSLNKAEIACHKMKGNIIPFACDLANPLSIQSLINSIDEPLDVIIANAGVMALPEKQIICGFEAHMFINHMAQAKLINALLPQLNSSGRIVIVSSGAHGYARGKGIDFDDLQWKRNYKPWVAYGQSKLANILFTRELAKRLPPSQTVNCLHPGIIKSNLWRHVAKDEADKIMGNMKYQSIEKGAATSVYLACHPDAQQFNGEYMSNGALGKPSALALNPELANRLWQVTNEVTLFGVK